MTAITNIDANGCPSGLAPRASQDPMGTRLADPAPFVTIDDGRARLELAVKGAKCAGCLSKIESAMMALPGVERARLNLSTGRMTIDWRAGALQPIAIVEKLGAIGYQASPFDPAVGIEEDAATSKMLLKSLAVAGFAMANVMLLSVAIWSGEGEMGPNLRALLHYFSALIAVPAALYAGRPFFTSAWASVRKGGANMDVPISLAVILSLSLSLYELFNGGAETYFDAAVMLLFFLLIGRFLDHRLRQKARVAARQLLALQATTATRIAANGDASAVAVRDIAPGDTLLVAPGDYVPVDGVIDEGSSTVDLSLVTGESEPVRKSVGDQLHAGVINLSERILFRAERTVDASLVAELTRLVEAGEQSKARYVRLADRAAALYVPIVHSLALITFAAWFFAIGAGFREAVMNAIAVLIITCPCALGLAAPAVQVVATGRLFRAGILVKAGDALERLAEANAFVFDKTGTLTIGRPAIDGCEEVDAATLAAAARLARISRHPYSRAIVEAAGAGPVCADAVEHAGLGVAGVIDGAPARLGRGDWVGVDPSIADEPSSAWFKVGDAPAHRFIFKDRIRSDAKSVLNALRADGAEVVLLSGDRPAAAQEIAEDLGVDNWSAGVSPADKLARLQALAADGAKVAMVGDGLNDAPSLAGAHVSLSPGTAVDATRAAADFVYQGDGLAAIIEARTVSKQARRRVLENFAFAAAYNAVAVPLAAFGFVTPLIAALAMSGSSVIVILNALRLAKGGTSRLAEGGDA